MDYNVVLTDAAEEQLDNILFYLARVLNNKQAARSVWEDALDTVDRLKNAAGVFKLCEEPELAKYGYRKINFKSHEYLMLYLIDGNTVYVDRIYHRLQDYGNLQ
jgi:plasmid stabilization system protein ParE